MQKMPQVSVVCSVYNGERYLKDSIESILNQSFRNFEFILINDGSTDSSVQIIQKFAYQDKRIVVIDKKNTGLTKSLNEGLAIAKAEYVARQDADDISEINRLEKQYLFLENNKAYALVGCYRHDINEYGKTIIKYPTYHTNEELKKTLFYSNPFVHGSLMLRYNILNQVGFYNEKIKYAQDFDLILRIAERHKVFILPYYLYKLRINNNSISQKNFIEQDNYRDLAIKLSELRRNWEDENFDFWYKKIILKKIGPKKKYYLQKKKKAQWKINYGKKFFLLHDIILARKYFFTSFLTFPSSHALIYFLLTYSPKTYWLLSGKKRRLRY